MNQLFPVVEQFMDMRGKTTDFTFSHFLVELLEEKDPEVIKWTSFMGNVTKCKNINIKALVTEIEGLYHLFSSFLIHSKSLKLMVNVHQYVERKKYSYG